MSEIEQKGEAFMVGLGRIGATLLDISAGPCLRIDDARWSVNTARGNMLLSQARVARLIDGGWLAVAPERLMNREHLVLTDKGMEELINFCLKRSMELSEIDPPSVPSIGEAHPPETVQAIAFDLAAKAFDEAYARKKELPPQPALLVRGENGAEPTDLWIYLQGDKDDPPGRRLARLFGVINSLASASVVGLTIAQMSGIARWGGVMAAEAFERAPDQDWEPGESEA